MKGALLIVFVLTQEASQPETRAFTTAALEVLGAGAQVRVVKVQSDLADAKVQEQAAGAGADGAVELSWTGDRTRVLAHCYVPHQQRWIDRSISFDEGEDERERGRLLGYAVASMFLTGTDDERLDEASSGEPAAEARTQAPRSDGLRTTPLENTPADVAPGALEDDSSSIPHNSHGFDFAGMVSHGLGGEADAIGATAAFRFLTASELWARVGVGGRSGEIATAQASMKSLQGSAGADWYWLDTGRFTSTIRGDLIGSWLEVGHLSPDDPDVVRERRWLFGFDAVATGGLRLSAGTSLFAGGGLEAMFGRTDIYTHGSRVATIPPLRLIAEFGLKSEF